MARLAELRVGDWDQFTRRLYGTDLTAEEAVKLTEHPEVFSVMLTAMRQHPVFRFIHDLFISAEEQIARVRELNLEHGWGISEEAFAEAEKSVPAWPEERLVAVVLVPYLADKKAEDDTVTTGLERTFHELWEVAASAQHANWRWDGYDQAGPERLRLLKGIEYPSSEQATLRWEVMDLGCQRDRRLMDVRNPEKSPHAGILACAVLHPGWIKAMDGDKVPYVWAPGYEVNVSGEHPWRSVPYMVFDRGSRGIRLSFSWGDCYSGWAVPSFVR